MKHVLVRMKHVLVGIAVMLGCPIASVQDLAAQSMDLDVEAVVDHFNGAFDAGDVAAFEALLAPSVTMITPFHPRRMDGKEAVMEVLGPLLRQRSEMPQSPPHRRKRAVQQVADDVAVVTFETQLDGALGRNTLVLRRASGGWLVESVHVSRIPTS